MSVTQSGQSGGARHTDYTTLSKIHTHTHTHTHTRFVLLKKTDRRNRPETSADEGTGSSSGVFMLEMQRGFHACHARPERRTRSQFTAQPKLRRWTKEPGDASSRMRNVKIPESNEFNTNPGSSLTNTRRNSASSTKPPIIAQLQHATKNTFWLQQLPRQIGSLYNSGRNCSFTSASSNHSKKYTILIGFTHQ